jgi:hypothetical protein
MKRTIFFSLLIIAVTGSLLAGAGFPQSPQRNVDDGLGQETNQKEGDRDDNDDDEKIPESWRGTWKVTVAYRDHETGTLLSTDVTTAEICPREPIIPHLEIHSLKCWTNAGDNQIEVWCGAKQSLYPGCKVLVNTLLQSKRKGKIWTGTGSWTAKGFGTCGRISVGEDFTVSGTRVSNEAACFGGKSNLVSRFFANPELIRFLAQERQGNNHDEK